MSGNRRTFLKRAAGIGALTVLGNREEARAAPGKICSDQLGVLVDCTRCVGCRRCEKACNEINQDLPRQPAGAFEDASVFERRRRMDHRAYTVVNRSEDPDHPGSPVYALWGRLPESPTGPWSMMPPSASAVVTAWSPARFRFPPTNTATC
jgi:ferredoxin